MTKTSYAIVGTGSRATMYIDAICGTHAAHAELVALCDTSLVRVAYHNRRLADRYGRGQVPGYDAARFAAMLAEQRPDVVIVTTVDTYHHRYIVAAMEHGCDVVSEKPMTTDDEKVAVILDAIERTGRRLRVTFNYRYSPAYTRMRQLVASGAIGVPRLVDFSWMLDTSHGADYFRRWHREKDMSGGLLVHKATHHFDLVNWWIGDWPQTVSALGALAFYGRRAAAARGESYAYARYTGQGSGADPFALDLDRSPMLRGLYADAEAETGYLRDRNVFGDDISIEDTMAVNARYRGGALLSYSLVAYSPWEGLRVAITGDAGRVELYERHGAHVLERTPTGAAGEPSPGDCGPGGPGTEPARTIRLFPMFAPPAEVVIPDGGPHGGDALMLEQIFDPAAPPDPDGRAASHLDGAASVLLGTAANRSIETGGPVRLDELAAPLPADRLAD